MSAKDASLQRASVYVSDGRSHSAEGISKIEVYATFLAKWRGRSVVVTMSADRYAASSGDGGNRLTDWRTYASEARYSDDPERRNGDHVTGTARAALGDLCKPLVMEWLGSDEYAERFSAAVARAVMSHLTRDQYNGGQRVSEALATFAGILTPAQHEAISAALDAYNAFHAAVAAANKTIG